MKRFNYVNELFASLKVNRKKYIAEVSFLSNHCDIESEYNPTTNTTNLIFIKATKKDDCNYTLIYKDPSSGFRLVKYRGSLGFEVNN